MPLRLRAPSDRPNRRERPAGAARQARISDVSRQGVEPIATRAVVDIGSNSVRLAAFETLGHAQIPVFNEKVMCALGRTQADGSLREEAQREAIDAITRYAALARALRSDSVDMLATAAVRSAPNGEAFAKAVEEATGTAVTILSGEEEGRLSALGVLSRAPRARGLVADLGGGSLEILHVPFSKPELGSPGPVSLPLGALALATKVDTPNAGYKHVLSALKASGTAKLPKDEALYLVGGAWRNIVRLHMTRTNHPVLALQGYRVAATALAQTARSVMDLSPETLSGMDDISKRRADVLPYAAAALLAVIDHCKAETIVVSAAGLREGALFARAGAAADDWDPLEASCWLLSYRGVRDAAFGREAAAFIAPVAETCDARVKRLIGAAAMCADLTWQRLPDERADAAFQELMAAPLADVDHEDRVLLAAMVFHRYAGANDSPDEDEVLALLDEADLADARRVGVALRLAATLSARAGGVLNQMRLVAEGGDLVLETTRETRDFLGGSVYKRGEQLAQLMGRNFAVR